MNTISRIAALLLCLIGVNASVVAELEVLIPSDEAKAPRSRIRLETLRGVPEDFFNSLTYPTGAMKIGRPATEWDTTRALMVSLPIKEFLADEKFAEFYLNYLGTAVRYVDIVISHDVAETRYLARFEDRLYSDERLAGKESKVFLAETRSSSPWIRDFGPIFAFDRRGRLVLLDSIYRSLEGEIESFANSPIDLDSGALEQDFSKFFEHRQMGRKDDVTPLYLSKFIRQDLGIACDTVRPPMHLQGGDYIADGRGNVFISEDTVTANGGRKRHVEIMMRDYFGAENVHILGALPGTTAKHLDMLLKLVAPEVMLYSEAPQLNVRSSVFNTRLTKRAGAIQEANLEYLRKQFPLMRFISVPTPPILEDSSEIVHATIRSQLKATISEMLGINYLRYLNLPPGDANRVSADKMMVKHMQEEVGRPVNLWVREDLDAVCQVFFNSTLDALEQFHVSSSTIYRSYTNSIMLNTEEAGIVFLVPRYKPGEGESQADFDAMERSVAAAYRSAYPEARFHWIESDLMAERLGALHCLSTTIPEAKAR